MNPKRKNFMKTVVFIIGGLFYQLNLCSQTCNNLNITHQADIASVCSGIAMTMIHDDLSRPYLYVANKEAGLKIYDITTITSPILVATVPTTAFDTLHVMNVSQTGNYLYLAVGNSFTNPQKGGMAIIDVTNPSAPSVTDYYVVPGSHSGGGIVKVEGNYAYLGAMGSGLVVLDVTSKSNIQFVSQFVPSINYPPITNPNPNYYNARGMDVKNSIVYLCYDGGGFRIINCTNKLAPKETGRWCNPVMYTPLDHPKAYNNIVVDGNLAYIAVDYAGMEVLNISDTSNITLTGWWNPYNAPNNNWFSSQVHANEIHLDKNCNHIFMSTGKSDMMVVDVTNPTQPDSCNFYGGVSNGLGTWGIGLYQNQIYLTYICSVIPFASNWTGVKILTYTPCTTGLGESAVFDNIKVFPTPADCELTVEMENKNWISLDLKISVSNVLGQNCKSPYTVPSSDKIVVDISSLNSGIYFLHLSVNDKTLTRKFIKD